MDKACNTVDTSFVKFEEILDIIVNRKFGDLFR